MRRRGRGQLTERLRRLASVARRRRAGAVPPRPTRWDPTQTSALYTWCVASGIDTRPQYLWPVLQATHAARALGIPTIAVLEFGVAGGNGLLALERAAEAATDLSGTEVEVYGFDSGRGMPASDDHRDAPWLSEPALFDMDEPALRARLRTARLVLGPVSETARAWADSDHPPIGFVAFDLDLYTSTRDAFAVLDGDPAGLLPRVPCYFDDLFGYGWTEFTGVHAAIQEFNRVHEHRKIGKIHGLRYELPARDADEAWHEKLFVAHVFDHPRYREREGTIDDRWRESHRLAER